MWQFFQEIWACGLMGHGTDDFFWTSWNWIFRITNSNLQNWVNLRSEIPTYGYVAFFISKLFAIYVVVYVQVPQYQVIYIRMWITDSHSLNVSKNLARCLASYTERIFLVYLKISNFEGASMGLNGAPYLHVWFQNSIVRSYFKPMTIIYPWLTDYYNVNHIWSNES